jgi:hypothetical protein
MAKNQPAPFSYTAFSIGKKHRVLLMMDVGDLRKGVSFFPIYVLDCCRKWVMQGRDEFEPENFYCRR